MVLADARIRSGSTPPLRRGGGFSQRVHQVQEKSTANVVGITPQSTLGATPGVYATCEMRQLGATKSDQPSQSLIAQDLSPGWPPNTSDLGPGFRKASSGSSCGRRRQQVAVAGRIARIERKQGSHVAVMCSFHCLAPNGTGSWIHGCSSFKSHNMHACRNALLIPCVRARACRNPRREETGWRLFVPTNMSPMLQK